VVAVFNELEDSQVPRYLKVIKRFEGSSKILVMLDVILKSMLTCAIGYLLVGAVSYSAFPKTIQSNIFNTFGYDSVIISTARLIVGVLQIASYPVNHFPARKALSEGIIMPLLKKEPSGNGFVFVETSVFFTLSLILALSFTELGTVFSLVGGTSGTVIIFIIPGALLLHEARDHHQQNIRILFSISGGFLILFGAGLFLYTLISTL
jgi:amino acid permease